ncbi:MAG: DUF4432 family protein [Anaerolineae bacterium]
MAPICVAQTSVLDSGMRVLRIENDRLSATFLLDKGSDVYELTFKDTGIDVLWKSPWGMKTPGRGFQHSFDSLSAWLEAYAGGWQLLFPNGGTGVTYKGAGLGFHGEASMTAWDCTITQSAGDWSEAHLTTRLFLSPFRLERTVRVEAGQPVLILRERITNEAGEPMDYMWSHHPAFGAPFLSEACVVDTGATHLLADDGYVGTANPMTVAADYAWPQAGSADMSKVPGQATERDALGYLHTFSSGWYGITNTQLGFGVGLVWDASVFPYAWYWQEMHASAGFPWYKSAYVMAIEPASSIPGQGLLNVMEKTQTHRTLGPGESVETEMRAVFYTSSKGIDGIAPDGTVTLKP